MRVLCCHCHHRYSSTPAFLTVCFSWLDLLCIAIRASSTSKCRAWMVGSWCSWILGQFLLKVRDLQIQCGRPWRESMKWKSWLEFGMELSKSNISLAKQFFLLLWDSCWFFRRHQICFDQLNQWYLVLVCGQKVFGVSSTSMTYPMVTSSWRQSSWSGISWILCCFGLYVRLCAGGSRGKFSKV